MSEPTPRMHVLGLVSLVIPLDYNESNISGGSRRPGTPGGSLASDP